MLILQPGTARSEEAWERRLTAARQALAQRSGKSTDVVLLGYEPDQDAPGSQQQTTDRLSVIPQQLQGAGSGVTKLAVEHTGLLPPTFLTTAASAFPHLHTLSVDQCTCPLPLPAQMPQLRTLQVTIPPPSYNTNDGVWEEHPTTLAVLQSIAAHLPQLTSLDISLEQSEGEEAFNLPWQEILTPASTTHTLTHLTTTDELTDTLITRLIDHAPAIQHVSVAGLYVQTDFHEQGRQWGLQSLVLSCEELYADELALLPACTAGPLSVVGQGSMLGFEVQGRQVGEGEQHVHHASTATLHATCTWAVRVKHAHPEPVTRMTHCARGGCATQ